MAGQRDRAHAAPRRSTWSAASRAVCGARCPLVRVLIHQNKAWKTMQNANDFGGIETWQHGPVYIFNNLSHDARGPVGGPRAVTTGGHARVRPRLLPRRRIQELPLQQHRLGQVQRPDQPAGQLLGVPGDPQLPELLLQQHGLQLRRRARGGRRRRPGATSSSATSGRTSADWVFWHAKPAESPREANADHAGEQGGHFDFGTNAYRAQCVPQLQPASISGPTRRMADGSPRPEEFARDARSGPGRWPPELGSWTPSAAGQSGGGRFPPAQCRFGRRSSRGPGLRAVGARRGGGGVELPSRG